MSKEKGCIIHIMDVYQYWTDQKIAYENNLKNKIGHEESIRQLLVKINEKLINLQ